MEKLPESTQQALSGTLSVFCSGADRLCLGAQPQPKNTSATVVPCVPLPRTRPRFVANYFSLLLPFPFSQWGTKYPCQRHGRCHGGSREVPPDHRQEGNEVQQFRCGQPFAEAMEVCPSHTSSTSQALGAGTLLRQDEDS